MTHQPRRILVVDDLPDWRTTLSNLLTFEGYEVQAAGSVDSALAALRTCSFDLAVVDIRLDETDESDEQGLELADVIKREWPAVKVVIITGYSTLDRVNRAMEPHVTGSKLADSYVEKDRSAELARIVERVLRT